MKYIWKKENPLEPVNTEIEVTEQDWYVSVHYSPITKNLEASPKDIKKLIDEGWIKEVKPLEVWINVYGNDFRQNYSSFEEAKEAAVASTNHLRTARFVEVKD